MALVVVALSGGVDSAVAAGLLKQAGHEVIGVTMRLWTEERDDLPPSFRRCCSIEAVDDARRSCQALGIPHYVLNLEREFRTTVVDYFLSEYARGRTPNPCLACNQHVKFRFLLERARALGAEFLATGHYARIEQSNGAFRLLKGVDAAKDQSYVLYTLGQEELAHLLFPVGGYRKTEVRRLAAAWGLPVAEKPESQEICFVSGDYREFLGRYVRPEPGEIVDTAGRVVGKHRGLACYTVGQRHGLGVALGWPAYVVALEPATNRVVVGPKEEMATRGLRAREVHFVNGTDEIRNSKFEFRNLDMTACYRYRGPEAPAKVTVRAEEALVEFATPQGAIAPGQAVVFYRGEEVVGGGVIEGRITQWASSPRT